MNSQATSLTAWMRHRSEIAARLVYLREISRTAFWEFCNSIPRQADIFSFGRYVSKVPHKQTHTTQPSSPHSITSSESNCIELAQRFSGFQQQPRKRPLPTA